MDDQTSVSSNPQQKLAIFFAYNGSGYQGMQINPGAKTIESELQQALYVSNSITQTQRNCPKLFHFARSARTDKGVSAIGQVVSGKFFIDPDNAFVERLNNNLPLQLRVFGYKIVDKLFSAKKSCDGRKYVYLLPVFALDSASHRDRESVLASLGSGNELVRCFECSERGRKVFKAANDDSGTGFVGEVQSGISSNTLCALSSFDNDGDNVSNSDDLVRKNVFGYGEKERERFNKILKQYEGTHNFHNFTTRTKVDDPTAKRCIISFNANSTVMIDGIEFVKCEVVGKSFMLHQIRKMIGLAVAVMRNGASDSLIKTALRQDVKVNIPTAPEVGLYLDECFFSSYNQKWKDTHEEVSMKDYAEEAEEFKLKHIYSHIASTEHKQGVVAVWLHSLNYRNYPDLCPKENSRANKVARTQTEDTPRCYRDAFNPLNYPGHILPSCNVTNTVHGYEKPTVHEIDLEHLATAMKNRLNLVMPFIPELRVRYGGVTDNSITDTIISDVNMLVDTAMSVTYNRLRLILQIYEPTVFVAQMNPKSPLSNKFKFPAYISYVLSSIGPMRIMDGRLESLVVYATSAERSQTYGRAQHFDFIPSHFYRLIDNLAAIGAPLAAIDVKGSNREGGSFYPTILTDHRNGLWEFTATFHPSHYVLRDILSAWLTQNDNPGLRAFPDCSLRIECCADPDVVNAVIASRPEGVPDDLNGATAPPRLVGRMFNVNAFGVRPAVAAEDGKPAVPAAVYIVGRGATRYYCTSLAWEMKEHEMGSILGDYILKFDASWPIYRF